MTIVTGGLGHAAVRGTIVADGMGISRSGDTSASAGLPIGPLRFRAWTSATVVPATAGLPLGPLRFRAWTSADADTPSASGIPFGPLRFRAWTSAAASSQPAETSVSVGPLRFRPWTSGPAITVPPPSGGGVGFPPFVVPIPPSLRAQLLDEDEIILAAIAAWLHSTQGTLQ